MTARLFAIILSLWHAMGVRSTEARELASDIAAVAGDEYEAALASYYMALESGVRRRPNAQSWDASMGVSCSVLQMPCSYVSTHSVRQQVRWWLSVVRAGGLVSLDSSPTRAARRFNASMRLLAQVR